MARKTGLFIFIACIFFLGGCASSGGGGGGSGNLYGTVVNLSYDPVSNADVIVDSTAAKTLSNGTYSFINLSSGDKVIRISSPAYTSSYRKVSFSGGSSTNAGIAFLADLDSKVTPISNSGGTATNTNGSIKMVFPAGAFDTTTNVVLTTVPKVAAPYNPPEGDQFVSYIVFAKPDTAVLSADATISVPNLTGMSPTFEVSFYKFNTDSLVWESLPGHGHATTETNTIDFNTTQMGWIAAIMLITPAPGWIEGVVTDGVNPVQGANVWTLSSYDVSDSFGSYRLDDIPEGTAEVHASALGYSPFTTTSPIVINSGSPTSLNIPLSVQSQGNIEGIVREWGDGYIQNARVTAYQGGIQKGVAYTDEYGRYTLYNLPSSATNVSAYADEHMSSTESVTVIGGSTVSDVNFYLPEAGPAVSYDFTFETSTEGFTTEADSYGHNFWHWQYFDSSLFNSNPQNYFNRTDTGKTRKVYLKDDGVISKDGKIPSPHGGSYYFWYGQATPATSEASYIGIEASDDTVEGSGGISSNAFGNSGTLESPVLDLTGYSLGNLSFWTWWEIEGKNPATGYDSMYIFASKGPSYGTWDLIGALNPYDDPAKTLIITGEAYTSGGFNLPGVWVKHNFDLSPYAGNVIKLRFLFKTYDFLYNGFRGWFIDDIKVENSQYGISAFKPNLIRFYPGTPRTPRN